MAGVPTIEAVGAKGTYEMALMQSDQVVMFDNRGLNSRRQSHEYIVIKNIRISMGLVNVIVYRN